MTAPHHDHIFVYGTLQRSAGHPFGAKMREMADFIGEGSIAARLYIVTDPDDATNAYPGALPSPNPEERVHGEIYAIRDREALFAALDRFEGIAPDLPEPHEFALRSVEVTTAAGALRAHSYLYNWDVSDARRLEDGRYTEAAPDVR